jgi:hypothetical protein
MTRRFQFWLIGRLQISNDQVGDKRQCQRDKFTPHSCDACQEQSIGQKTEEK